MDQTSLFSHAPTSRARSVSNRLLYLFLAFQIPNQTILPVLVITFLLTSAKRLPTLVSACFTWIFAGIFSSLLFYAGNHLGPEPPQLLCVTQATLLDGVPPMTSVAILVLMFQTYQCICKPNSKSRKAFTYALVLAPYFAFFCFAMTASILMMHHPEKVTRARRFYYCSFENHVFSQFFTLFTAVMLLATIGFILAIGLFIYRNWRTLRQPGALDVQSLSRVIVFASYVILMFSISIHSTVGVGSFSPIPDLFTASVGTLLALSLGSHPDIYRVWFRRPLPTPPQSKPATDNLVSINVNELHRLYEEEHSPTEHVYTTAVGTSKVVLGQGVSVFEISEKLELGMK